MPDLDFFERLAASRWTLDIVLMMAVCGEAFVIRRLYRDKNLLHGRMESLQERLVQLLEKIYERRIGDLRHTVESTQEHPQGSQAKSAEPDAGRPLL